MRKGLEFGRVLGRVSKFEIQTSSLNLAQETEKSKRTRIYVLWAL